ncbi:nucleoside transporter [candidate division WOR-3 bacterium]|nr:nucleoside transporter [candidate division WOR-3 bacterium]
MDIYNLISFFGIFVLIGIAWLLSTNKRNMNWRVILWGIILQLCIALFVFVFPGGSKLFLFLNDFVVRVLDSATAGSKFVFGRLALPPGQVSEAGEKSIGFILAFQAFPTIIFFSALMSILYFFNIMQWTLKGFAYVFTKLMRISGAESLCAASNIFVGIESALTIKPYLSRMTRSELCTILTVGMATVASNVLAVYVFSLQEQFSTIAAHLISASFLSAPAALIMAKVIMPESGIPKTLGEHVEIHYEKETNIFESIINGANAGVKLIVGIVALLIAVLGLVALLDLILGVFGGKLNAFLGTGIDWTLKGLLGYIFYPFTLILGVPPSDAGIIAQIIGERSIVTEVPAYQDLAIVMSKGLLQHPRSAVIATYALCGFAHIASMAIFVGGVSALVPEKRQVLARVGFRALIAATLACLMTACVAGAFFIKGSLLFGG